jgi:rubrerythrin
MQLKGSQTEQNLITAFAGESKARNRYTYFAGQARKEGLMQIAWAFEETADQEKEHAKRFFSLLEGGEAQVQALFPAGKVAKTARAEGYEAAAKLFELIAVAEKQHERRYRGLLASVEAGTVITTKSKVKWRCRNCGYIHEGETAPQAPGLRPPAGLFRGRGRELVSRPPALT